MNYAWKVRCLPLVLLLGMIFSANYASYAGAKQESSSSAKNTATEFSKQEDEIRKLLSELSQSINARDQKKSAAVWAEDSLLIDQTGEETHGRKELEQRFEILFKQESAPQLTLHPESISLPAPNVALVVGSVSRKSGEHFIPDSRFNMVFVKEGQSWFIKQASETALQRTSAADMLKSLSWLIGKWRVEKSGGSTTLELNYLPGNNFILSKCLIERQDGLPPEQDTQLIGFDPRSKSIVSWHFDYHGGFGYAKWKQESNKIELDFAGVSAEGGSMRAKNIFVQKSNDEFSWQSVDQSLDGTAIDDTGLVSVKRLNTK